MPCPICHEFQGIGDYFVKNKSDWGRKYRHHVKLGLTWGDLEASASSCEECCILLRGCRGTFRQHGIEESQVLHCHISFYYEAFEYDEDDNDSDVDKEVFFRMKDDSWFAVQVFADPGDEYPVLNKWESIPVWNRASPRTDSDEAFETAQRWITDCQSSSHKFCRSPRSPALPTRVLDVGLSNGVVKLIESNGTKGRYLCLSHCWGTDQIVMTRKANIQDYKREIRLSSLPKTFQDAVLLTRRLGIQYIWIDSLCIVQDDDADWKSESAKMARIYCQAHLTIAATRSRSGAGGLYTSTPDFEVSGITSLGEKYSLFFREKVDHHLEFSSPIHLDGADDRELIGRSTLERHPLITRAWVFQERLLSTRVLHFGPYELFFECRTSMQCECGGIEYFGSSEDIPIGSTKLLHDYTLAHHKLHQQVSEKSPGYAQLWISRLWRTMVSSYTSLDITKPQDRLPAIGGLAKNMHSKKASAYLAGLWQDSLNDDLLWVVHTTSAHRKPRPLPRCAPTWSWASIDTALLYSDEILTWHPDIYIIEHLQTKDDQLSKHLASVVSCTVVPDGVDEFGTVSQGTLKISGAVSEGILEREVQTHRGQPRVVHYVSFSGDSRFEAKPDYLLDHQGPDQVTPGTRVSCLRMGVIREGKVEKLMSLVLRPTTNSSILERIGTLSIETISPPVDINSGIFDSTGVRTVTIQ